MGLFNFFGDQEHNVFDYKPIYYDKEKDELKRKFSSVDGSREKAAAEPKDGQENSEKGKAYSPGTYIQGAFRDGHYQKSRHASTKAQNIIGIVGLILVVVVLMYIAKFYSLL